MKTNALWLLLSLAACGPKGPNDCDDEGLTIIRDDHHLICRNGEWKDQGVLYGR